MAGTLKSGSIETNGKLARRCIALVVAEWNEEITGALQEAAYACLLQHGIKKKNILIKQVPGTFELSLGALWMAEQKKVDAVICLGCVVQGETPHFDYICQAVAYGITEVGLKTKKPVIFGVLTTANHQQALDRAGGKYGNKGEEAALTALSMLQF